MNADPKAFGKLLCLIVEQKIEIRIENGQIRCRAPKGIVTEDVLQCIRHFKHTLIQLYGPTTYSPMIDNLPWNWAVNSQHND